MADSTIKVIEAVTGGTDLASISFTQGVTTVKAGKQTIVDQTGAEVTFAKDASVTAVTTSLGSDGATPPTIPGTGVRGWLRSIYDRLSATLTVSGTVEVMNDAGNPLPVSGTITANAGTGTFNIRALASGTDSVTTVPSGTQTVSGTVSVTQTTAANLQATVTQTNAANLQATVNQGTAGASAWPVTVGNFPATQTVAGTVTANAGTGTFNTQLSAGVGTAVGTPLFAGISVGGAAASVTNPLYTNFPPSTSTTTTGVAAAAATLTIPAPAAGQFNYITGIEILLVNTAARAAAAATLITVTTTNIGGTLSWSYGSPVTTVGSTDSTVSVIFSSPLKATTAATASTIVAPATTGVQWMLKAYYYQAP